MMSSIGSANNSLLNDVVANYLATLSEIEFFDAFDAVLRANEFYDVHLTHGTAEHGKDFIAKRVDNGVVTQYGIQTKVGDIGVSSFRECRNQIESIRLTDLSHPAFDENLPRRGILVTTGRLVGQASTEAQHYKHWASSERFKFDVWQIGDLLTMMVDTPEAGLAGDLDAPLLGAIAAIHEGIFTEASLDKLSTGWSKPIGNTVGIWRAALSALVLANRLARFGRRDLAAMVGAHLVRAAWARADNTDLASNEGLSVADVGRGLLVHHARVLFEEVRSLPQTPRALLDVQPGIAPYVSYPVRCMRLIELFGLMGLAEKDYQRRDEIVRFCITFIKEQPGASHPISDHWAVCIPPAALLIRQQDTSLLGSWLQEICVWVADHYDNGRVGLAGPWSDPREEIALLLGNSLEHLDYGRRSESFTCSVLLDLAAALELGDIYDSVINEVMAARIHPPTVECEDGPGLYLDTADGVYMEQWVQYDGHFNDNDGWWCSGPHRRAKVFKLQKVGRAWDLLAICAVRRDRCFPLLLREIACLAA